MFASETGAFFFRFGRAGSLFIARSFFSSAARIRAARSMNAMNVPPGDGPPEQMDSGGEEPAPEEDAADQPVEEEDGVEDDVPEELEAEIHSALQPQASCESASW